MGNTITSLVQEDIQLLTEGEERQLEGRHKTLFVDLESGWHFRAVR